MGKDPNHVEPPIKAVIDATNRGDGRAFVDVFAKDATITDWGETHAGRKEITAWDREQNTGAGTRLKITGVSRLGGEVLVLLTITRGETTETGTWAFRTKGQQVVSLDIG